MKKFIALVLAVVIAVFAFAGCKKEETGMKEVDISSLNVGVVKGYLGVGMAGIIDSEKCNVTVTDTADELKELFVKGDVEVAAVPLNLAGKLCNELETNLRIFAVTNLGVMHIMDSTGEVKKLSDLTGKTVYATGKGLTSEFILN